MGKVTIIVESEGMTTNQLEELIQNGLSWESFINSLAEDNYQIQADARVYVVPSDD